MNFCLRLFMFSGLLIASTTNALAADLEQLLRSKQAHFQSMSGYYHSQIGMIEKSDFPLFCKTVREIYPTLDQIYREDALLIAELRRGDEDSVEYAQLLTDNAQSDLFAYVAQSERCRNQNFEPRAGFLQSVRYSEMNVNYLWTTHTLWMSAHGLRLD